MKIVKTERVHHPERKGQGTKLMVTTACGQILLATDDGWSEGKQWYTWRRLPTFDRLGWFATHSANCALHRFQKEVQQASDEALLRSWIPEEKLLEMKFAEESKAAAGTDEPLWAPILLGMLAGGGIVSVVCGILWSVLCAS
jgi:hypothetical protein